MCAGGVDILQHDPVPEEDLGSHEHGEPQRLSGQKRRDRPPVRESQPIVQSHHRQLPYQWAYPDMGPCPQHLDALPSILLQLHGVYWT